ncbi:class I SAM-dependent methyltransferase [Pelagicoccus sp. SDUM812003]|uniref:class I SAM-dependent methyltransferase n=1 Tax=Pelagicoccus sp. SDUM812003 TaxID=3041267 RepID=UPI00280CE4C3|nr:class I SAM-dependent methyltransferase [Pelagicoccus sp. SDUM812003]MDQ8204543.1 class I SAM-dependent methyltransferase [Pelagicoccus sp. SDUM812003]
MSKSSSDKASNDRALRFYRDVLGLERLHYGIWKESDELTFDALKRAQQRYEDLLIDSIPEDCSLVLDVGCGTGEMCMNLQKRGFQVEGLSPDRNQKKMFAEKIKAPFHHTKFEEFEPEEDRYDCIIMSESAQYIPMERLFKVARKALKPGGHLIVCDYFVRDHDAGILSKSGHCYETFQKLSADQGFKVIHREDITEATAKTLEMGKEIVDRLLAGLDIFTERFRERNRLSYRFVCWLLRKKIKKAQDQLPLLDAQRFCEVKRYEFFLFQALPTASAIDEDEELAAGAA